MPATGPRDFDALAPAIALAQQLASAEAQLRALDAGAASATVVLSRWDNQVHNDIDGNMFFEARVTATASGPALTRTRYPATGHGRWRARASGLRRRWRARVCACAAAGCRGQDDALPDLAAGPVAVVWMVGQVGSRMLAGVFRDRPSSMTDCPIRMDRWSKHIGDALARQCAGRAIYPSDGPPYAPFQQWARRAEPLQTSPLLLQIHPQYGLWHAYRFALALPVLDPADAAELLQAGMQSAADLCLSCDGQPCLSACPVDAFTPQAYEVDRCAAHLHAPAGADCMATGCLARRACPVGSEYRYGPAHAGFHMAAFAGRRGGRAPGASEAGSGTTS